MTFGPLHLVVLAFDEPKFEGWIVEELDFLRETGIIRLVDALAVYRDAEGEISWRPFPPLCGNRPSMEARGVAKFVGPILNQNAVILHCFAQPSS